MAIKSGQILHDAYGFVIDRIQSAGVGNLSIPEDKVYELGNYQSVATIRDIPDLSFDMESTDTSVEVESLLAGVDPTTVTTGSYFDLSKSLSLDIISPFKAGNGSYAIVAGVVLPSLTLESASYRFGLRDNATQAFTLRGDSIYWAEGSPYSQEFITNGTTAGPYAFTNTPIVYSDNGVTRYALGVSLIDPVAKTYRRLFRGTDYTETSTGVTLTFTPAINQRVRISYASAVAASYPQTVHEGISVKPAAVRGKDLDVYVETSPGSGTLTRWTSVQSFEANYRVDLENDEEFGNHNYVATGFDVPTVDGNVVIKPRDTSELLARIRQVANVSANQVIGANSSAAFKMELRVKHPDTQAVIKTLYIPDARFTIPGNALGVQAKMTNTFTWSSDSGQMLVYKGARP